MSFKSNVKAVWDFLWKEDSLLSWIANIVLAFIVIKFIVYPVLGALMGTSFPIVAVVSGSMEHDGSFETWWTSVCRTELTTNTQIKQSDLYASYGIDKETFKTFPFTNGFNKGDLMILISPKNAKIGDVIVYAADRADPIIHRALKVDETDGKTFSTKGDHNCASASFEASIPESHTLGKAVLRIPYLGWVKLGFANLLHLIGIGSGY